MPSTEILGPPLRASQVPVHWLRASIMAQGSMYLPSSWSVTAPTREELVMFWGNSALPLLGWVAHVCLAEQTGYTGWCMHGNGSKWGYWLVAAEPGIVQD
jgi:hypothetical protein